MTNSLVVNLNIARALSRVPDHFNPRAVETVNTKPAPWYDAHRFAVDTLTRLISVWSLI